MNFESASFLSAYGLFSQLPKESHCEVAFAGRSNVGKSSLINRIFRKKNLARTSSVPGKTATINFYTLDPLTVVDLPGYGYAKAAKSEQERWSKLIANYLAADRDLRLIFLLLDMRHPPSKLDLQMISFLIDSEIPFVIVLTKADKCKKTERAARLQSFETEIPYFDDITVIPFSAVTQEGVTDIRNILTEIAEEELDETETGKE